MLSVSPVKLFTGELTALIQLKGNEALNSLIKEHRNFTEPEIKLFNKELYFSQTTSNLSVIGLVKLDYLINEIIKRLNLYSPHKIIIADSNGIVNYAEDKRKINRFINSVYLTPEESRIKNFEILTDNNIVKCTLLNNYNFYLIIEEDLSEDYNALDLSIFRIVLFSIVVFILIFILSGIMTRKLSTSLQSITKVADLVSEGNFSEKIEIKRNDEIGVLINAFNLMEDNLKASYDELNRMNEELRLRLDELIKTKTELSQKQKLALIGETVSKISHEIQNKIGGVSIWIQNMELDIPEKDHLRVYLNEVKQALNAFLKMLTSFKRFYRKPILEKEIVDVNHLVENIINQLCTDIKNKKLKIITKLDNKLPLISADKEQLEEAVMNLIINAVNFSPPEGKIELKTSTNKNEIEIEIGDEGPGLSTEDFENLFQPFYTTKSCGSGLGLAVTKNIIDAHNGSIESYNKENGGAVFKILLPFKNPDIQGVEDENSIS
jgi:signal transduction histidine kinase